jgi:hypothetical protein
MPIAMLDGVSEASWLIIVGFGLILCLAVFTIAIVFLANRLSDHDPPEHPECGERLEALERELQTIKLVLKRTGILPSPRDNPSPPTMHIRKGSA